MASLPSLNAIPSPAVSKNATFSTLSATFTDNLVSAVVVAVISSFVTPLGMFTEIKKLFNSSSAPEAVASIVIVLLSLEIDDVRPIPLPDTGTSVGATVTSGFTVGTGAIVGRAGDVGFGVGLPDGTTVVEVASMPLATVTSPLASSIDASEVNVNTKSSVKALVKLIVIVASLPSLNAIPSPAVSKKATFSTLPATFTDNLVSAVVVAVTLSFVTPSGRFTEIKKLFNNSSVPTAVASSVIVLLSVDIVEARLIPFLSAALTVIAENIEKIIAKAQINETIFLFFILIYSFYMFKILYTKIELF